MSRSAAALRKRGGRAFVETLFSPATGTVIASVSALTLSFSLLAEDPAEALGRPGLWMMGILMSAFFGHCVRPTPEPQASMRSTARARGIHWPSAPASSTTGALDGEPLLVAPFSRRRCVAWGIWIGSGDELLLRDARSSASTFVLDNGERVEIPAGRIEIVAPSKTLATFPVGLADTFLVEQRLHPPPALDNTDPARSNHPFSGDTGYEIALQPGATVALVNPITTDVTEDEAATYRDRLAQRRIVDGVPLLSCQ